MINNIYYIAGILNIDNIKTFSTGVSQRMTFFVCTLDHVRPVTVPPRALAQSHTSDRLCDQFYWRRISRQIE